MPVGVLINSFSIIFGGIFGAVLGHKLSNKIKTEITLIFGVCAMAMGVNAIGLMENMSAVIFSIIVGTIIGLTLHFSELVNKGAILLQKPIAKIFKNNNSDLSPDEFQSTLITIIVLFCASGTGIYGTLTSGMTGDNSVLISKSILDFFTAVIFACNLGYVVSAIAVPQFIIFFILFLSAQVIFPLTTPSMINDFKACGGFIMIATGFRMTKIKEFPIADMIPAMVIVMPVSWIWVNYIMTVI